jgi:MFS family permease
MTEALAGDAFHETTINHSTKSVVRRVIIGASLGTAFEWYDFFIYGSLSSIFSAQYFPKGSETAAFLAALATFGVGFAVRPLGALIFGHVGDTLGRKKTFLITIILMGLATAATGIVPTFESWGWFAPLAVVLLRLVQGLALGGEYGGAATYVAEHSPDAQRGLQTSWLQATATLGFAASIIVVFVCRIAIDDQSFVTWGWRIPFLLSLILLVFSVYLRLKLNESPVFNRMIREGRVSRAPLSEAFSGSENIWKMLVVCIGPTAGETVIFYTAQFYVLFFLTSTLKVPYAQAYAAMLVALFASIPLYVFFGWISDRLGRKPVILTAFAVGALAIFPTFNLIASASNPSLSAFQKRVDIGVRAHSCNLLLFSAPTTPCDKTRDLLTKAGLSYSLNDLALSNEAGVEVRIGDRTVSGFDDGTIRKVLSDAGYPGTPSPNEIDMPVLIGCLFLLLSLVAMAYAPLAALCVELFPARIRYSSVSLPYHLGTGWFGGFMPFVSAALGVHFGNIYAGLWYPVVVCIIALAVGLLFLPETKAAHISE